jgi:hypothetical protein
MTKTRKGDAKVIDFDGTLFFTDACLTAAAKEIVGQELQPDEIKRLPYPTQRKICRLGYTKFAHLSKPNTALIDHLRKADDGVELVLMSARYAEILDDTLALAKTTEIPFAQAILRETPDLRTPIWKTEQMDKLLRTYNHLEVFDDVKANLDHFIEHLPAGRVSYRQITEAGEIRNLN